MARALDVFGHDEVRQQDSLFRRWELGHLEPPPDRGTSVTNLSTKRLRGMAKAAFMARLVAGAIFVAFGVGKFTQHASEVTSFKTYGLPHADAFVYAIGIVEIGAGGPLIAGLAIRVAALVLAGDMVGAIILSGFKQGELISLTLAPAQLAVMLFVLWAGPGSHALDRRLANTRCQEVRTSSSQSSRLS